MKNISIFILAGVLIAVTAHAGAGEIADWTSRAKNNNQTFKSENGTIHISGKEAYAFSKEKFKVEPGKKYRLSGRFRSVSGTHGALFFGIAALDAEGKPIDGSAAIPRMGSETVLVEDVKTGDRIVKVGDASGWIQRGGSVIAFGIKNDYSDLPNRDLSRGTVTHIEKSGDVWEITVRLPFRKEYKKGLAVRQQIGAPYQYAVSGKKITDRWQEFSGEFSGDVMSQANHFAKGMYPGTGFVKAVAFVPGEKAAFEMKNVSFVETDKK